MKQIQLKMQRFQEQKVLQPEALREPKNLRRA